MKNKICKVTMILLILSASFQTAIYLQYKSLPRIKKSAGVYEVLNSEEAAIKIAKAVLEEKFDTQMETENFTATLKDSNQKHYKDDYWIIKYLGENDTTEILMRKYNGEIISIS